MIIKKANDILTQLINERNATKYRDTFANNIIDPPFEKEQIDRMNTINASLLEIEQTKLIEIQDPISDD